MNVTGTPLAGAHIIDLDRREDDRGFFARAWCERELAEHGIPTRIAQVNVGYSRRRGTLRGMHFQYPPAGETKLVRCTRGAVLDVAVDLRPESATYLRHVAVELTADNRRSLFIPERCAHGYQVLSDDTEIFYMAGAPYAPDHEGGLRHDDPRLGIAWPLPVAEISAKDREWPLLDEVEALVRRRMTEAQPE